MTNGKGVDSALATPIAALWDVPPSIQFEKRTSPGRREPFKAVYLNSRQNRMIERFDLPIVRAD